jgi:putative intracellular protease/amidase
MKTRVAAANNRNGMKPKACLLVFDGLADWEPAHALCEINKSKRFDVTTVGFSESSVTTMGGLALTPDITFRDVEVERTAIFILPGGDMWQEKSRPDLISLLHRLHAQNVPIAAICGATLEIARAGLTRRTHHTSNSIKYLKAMVPNYEDEDFYVTDLAVTDKNLITASGLGSLEFGRDVIKKLGILNDADTEMWFRMYKSGKIPEIWA